MQLQKLHKARLVLDDGSEVEVERIGRGRYTTAWANGSHVYLQTSERDASKEILASFADDEPRNPHLPQCRLVGYLDGANYRVYSMPKYRKVTARETRTAYDQLQQLIVLREKARLLANSRGEGRGWDINEAVRELLDNDNAGRALPASLRDAVELLLDAAANYGEYTLEFRKANVAADNDGTLILLDPLFDMDEVRSYYQRRRNAAKGY